MPASRTVALEHENARLSSALDESNSALAQLQTDFQVLKQQLDWFRRRLFGEKSEKRVDLDPVEQGNLLTGLGVEAPPVLDEPSTQTVTYERRNKVRDGAVNDSGLRFDASVPVKTIAVKDPAIEAIPENLREVIGEKVSYRLAQQPGSHVVLKYVRPVVKRKDTLAIVTAAAPGQVLERTAADVSFLAGMLVDKFHYHLPLYRGTRGVLAGIRLRGGQTRQLCVPFDRDTNPRKHRAPIIAEIEELLVQQADAQVAAILNQRGRTNCNGKPFNAHMVGHIRRSRGLETRTQRLRDQGMVTTRELADQLGYRASLPADMLLPSRPRTVQRRRCVFLGPDPHCSGCATAQDLRRVAVPLLSLSHFAESR